MWNIELDRHRDIMRAEAEAQALRQKQDFEARNPKKQAGTIFKIQKLFTNLKNRWICDDV